MKGFTLIEILTILGIVGALSLISILSLRALRPGIQLNGISRDLISDLRLAQQSTVTEQVEHSVYFKISERKYEIKRYGATEDILKTVFFPSEIININISGLTQVDSDCEARYNSYGAVRDSGTVVLENDSGIKTVNIKPSGFVSLSD